MPLYPRIFEKNSAENEKNLWKVRIILLSKKSIRDKFFTKSLSCVFSQYFSKNKEVFLIVSWLLMIESSIERFYFEKLQQKNFLEFFLFFGFFFIFYSVYEFFFPEKKNSWFIEMSKIEKNSFFCLFSTKELRWSLQKSFFFNKFNSAKKNLL